MTCEVDQLISRIVTEVKVASGLTLLHRAARKAVEAALPLPEPLQPPS